MEEDTRIRIGGIKFSEKLVQVTVILPTTGETSFNHLLHLLAGRQINIPFICQSLQKTYTESCFCVLHEDVDHVREVLDFFSFFKDKTAQFLPDVGTLTIFPHRHSLQLLGLILKTFADYRYPLHSISTSISAIAMNTDYQLLDEIVDKLSAIVTLPENHAPFRQEFRLTQLQ